MPEQARKELPPGVATGLAWTEAGGDVLYLESTLLPDGKGLTLTGQLGDVMQESAKAAQSYIWSHASELGIDPGAFPGRRRSPARTCRRDPERRSFGRRYGGSCIDVDVHEASRSATIRP